MAERDADKALQIAMRALQEIARVNRTYATAEPAFFAHVADAALDRIKRLGFVPTDKPV